MLSVTNPALEQLHKSLKSVSDEEDTEKCFRITPKDQRNLTLSYSEPAESDATYEFKGQTVLAVPKELEEFCADKSLDVNDDGGLELA